MVGLWDCINSEPHFGKFLQLVYLTSCRMLALPLSYAVLKFGSAIDGVGWPTAETIFASGVSCS